MSRLNIIRASAGSGKTHFLTGFFLKTIIKEPVNYFREILAVTFTNKATAEMKRRILGELNMLSSGKPSSYLALLIKSTGYTETRVREKCAILLKTILHDYSWFSIETIDSFFQRIIRGFTHEIGIPGNYLIEIEHQPVLEFAVDRLLDTVHDNEACLEWLIQYAEDRILEGKAWEIRHSLISLGYEVFKEEFNENLDHIIAALSDRKGIKEFRNELMQLKFSFESLIMEIGASATDIISSRGFTVDDFYQRSNGPVKIFKKLSSADIMNSKGEFLTETAIAAKLLEKAENWASSDTIRKKEVISLAENELLPLLTESRNIIEKQYTGYYTAAEILKNLYAAGILGDLAEKIREYRLEQNAFILSDAPVLINSIINHNDSPFIYEKMGNRYGHFLIDEFQDTSALQWHNFKPLISNSLSQGNDNLVVGDVKQSIYRWRNSDWEILANKLNNEYPHDNLHFENLTVNWRSGEQLVRLFNFLFPVLTKRLKDLLETEPGYTATELMDLKTLDNIYSDVIQEVPKAHLGRGEVFIRFFSSQEVSGSENYFHEIIITKINELLNRGFAPKEIAILVRNGKEGQTIAKLLVGLNADNRFTTDLNILSEESLFLKVSDAVSLIVAALQYLTSPAEDMVVAKLIACVGVFNHTKITTDVQPLNLNGDSLSEVNIDKKLPEEFIKQRNMLVSLTLYDLAERLIDIFKLNRFRHEIPYLHAFLDTLHEYTLSNPTNTEKFLKFWQEKGQYRTIPATESQNAIRIFTIHKAKGLEFRAVILPFCSWNLDQKPNTTLWAETEKLSFNYLPIIPITYHRGLKDTEFAPVYYNEKFKSHVDNLNLLYVAFTRAIDSLIVLPVYNNSENRIEKIKTVGDLLYESIVHGGVPELMAHYDKTSTTLHISPLKSDSSANDTNSVGELFFETDISIPALERLSFRSNSTGYFKKNDTLPSPGVRRGSVLHSILASVVHHSDLERVVKQAVLDGLLTGPEANELRDHIIACFSEERVVTWFNGSGEVFTEKDILLRNGDIRRPDRVVVFPDMIHVIDYKFGDERFMELHRKQVLDYVSVLENMNYKSIKGFIWYIDQNKVIVA